MVSRTHLTLSMTSLQDRNNLVATNNSIESGSELRPMDRSDSATRIWLYSGIFWMSVTMLIGLIEAVKLFYPEFLQGIPMLAYGRLRPVHINIGLFGFMSMGYLGATFYMVPRLTQTPLFSERLGSITAWVWNFNLVGGCLGILMGYSKGKEYTEIPFPFDMVIGLLVIAIAGNLFSTITMRREQRVYVSLWYILLAIIPFPIYYTLGNASKFSGIEDAIINWFYSHNLFGIWLTTLGLATLYYIVPKQVNKPLYSHIVSFVGFWSLAAFYPWNGGHHVIWGPVPMWVMTASVTASIAMFVPTFATMVNFGGTAWGTWAIMKQDIGYRFSLMAYACYVGASLWGTGLAVMSLNAKLHFTNMTIAHVHLGFLGFGVPGLIAFTYFYIERSLKLKYSRPLAEWHFWLTMLGIVGYVVSMGISGWVEGSAWEAGNSPQGTMVDRYPYHVARAISGLIVLLGQFLFVTNVVKTVNAPAALTETSPDALQS